MNPFIIAGKIPPSCFCDRKEERESIIRGVNNGNNIVMVASRRIGKTGLINFCFEDERIKNRFTTIFIDILHTTSLQEFVYEFGRRVFDSLSTKGGKMIKLLIATLKSINASFGIDPSGKVTLNLRLGEVVSPEYTLEEIFKCLELAETPCLVAIDEFQQITAYQNKGTEALLRSFIQRTEKTRFIFSGSQRHIMNDMFCASSRPFYMSAEMMNVAPIAPKIYADFVVEKFMIYGKHIEEETVNAAYQLFEGNTYCNQRLFHEAFIETEETCTPTILLDTFLTILQAANHQYSELLTRLTEQQKEVLYAIAEEGKVQSITSGKFIRKHHLRSASSVQAALRKLLEHDMVTHLDNLYFLSDKMMELWIRNKNGDNTLIHAFTPIATM